MSLAPFTPSDIKTTENYIQPELIDEKNLPSISQVQNEYRQKIEELKNPRTYTKKQILIASGVILGSLAVIGLVGSQVISGAIALAVAGVVGVVGFYGLKLIKNYDPVIQTKLANHAIQKLLEEAQEKTIETLTRYKIYLEQKKKYALELMKIADSKINKYQSKIESVKDEQLKNFYNDLLNKIQNAKNSIEKIVEKTSKIEKDFDRQLVIAKEMRDFTKDTKDILTFLNQNGIDKILATESLNTIENEFYRTLSEINTISYQLEKEED